LVVTRLQPQTKLDGATLGQQRLLARLGGAFALLGLLLAAIGLEGTMAYAVNQRTREIGIRMALGSSRSHVLAATIGETVLLAGMGMVLGLALTLASGRVMASQLFGIRPQDPLTIAGAIVAVLLVSAAAAWLPARRAANVDPILALRAE
jgi:ABC-type antimicrobial peptide transport system permease subunit